MSHPDALRRDLLTIVQAGLAAAAATRLVERAFHDHDGSFSSFLESHAVHLVAAGKAAPEMAAAFARCYPGAVTGGLVVGTHRGADLPRALAWFQGGHPLPTAASEAAGVRALELASTCAGEPLVVLLSGGASALLVAPADGLALAAKQAVTSRLLHAGADICELNTVRKHLSRIKGGRLAAAHPGPTLALVISDVVGDDLSVIASGPTVPDRSRFAEALGVLDRRGGRRAYPPEAVRVLERGAAGEIPETPKPGDASLASATTRLIGSRQDVLDGAAEAARRLGYTVIGMPGPVIGEARQTGRVHVPRMLACARQAGGPSAVLSAGETTVQVTGTGSGGRNQELALSVVDLLADADGVALASVGSDGVDGPTDAAGAIVNQETAERARRAGLVAERFLRHNDSYHFFEALGDLVRTGPTGTNVGDFQVLVFRPASGRGAPADGPSAN